MMVLGIRRLELVKGLLGDEEHDVGWNKRHRQEPRQADAEGDMQAENPDGRNRGGPQ